MSDYEIQDPKAFIKAGKALFTVKNNDTGKRFTFKVTVSKNKKVHFVSVLNGSDNYSNYSYIGTIMPDGNFKWTPKSKVTRSCQSFKVFEWILHKVDNEKIPESVHIYHEGKCGRCGRRLTVPESVISGFGPECIHKVNLPNPESIAQNIEMGKYGFIGEAEMTV